MGSEACQSDHRVQGKAGEFSGSGKCVSVLIQGRSGDIHVPRWCDHVVVVCTVMKQDQNYSLHVRLVGVLFTLVEARADI